MPRNGRSFCRLAFMMLESRNAPATFQVNSLADIGAADPLDPFKGDLRYCLSQVQEAVSPGVDTIHWLTGLNGTISLTAGPLPLIDNGLTLVGPGSANVTVDGGDVFNHFDIDTGVAFADVAISGLKLLNGFAVGTGGSISVINANLTLADVIIDSARSDSGGAALVATGTGTLSASNCFFINSTIPAATGKFVGGAVEILHEQSATFSDCVFDGNILTPTGGTMAGGAIAIASAGSLTLTRCVVTNNHCNSAGGGIFGQNFDASTPMGAITITDCTIANNSSGNSGGGIALAPVAGLSGNLVIRNSTVAGNQAAVSGGGLRLVDSYAGTASVWNATFSANTAIGNGGGISRGGGTLNIVSSIFDANTGATGPDVGAASGVTITKSLLSNTSGVTYTDGGGNKTAVSAKLGPLTNNGGPALGTFSLLSRLPLAGSPTIDAGDNPNPTLNFDQRGGGFPRAFNGLPDMGAIESFAKNPNVLNYKGDPDITAAGTVGKFRFDITFTDDGAIDFTTLKNGNVEVSGNGYGTPAVATFLKVDVASDGTPRTATYEVSAPNTTFGLVDNGVYAVKVRANQVADKSGLFVAPVTVGTFRVAIGQSFTVNASNDEAADSDGLMSLREAVLAADASLGDDTIAWSSLFSTAQTITLNGALGDLRVTDQLTILAPAAKVTVDGGLAIRHFQVTSNPAIPSVADKFSIANMNLVNGRGNGDGGSIIVLVPATFAAADVAFAGNQTAVAGASGGAVAAAGANMTFDRCSFEGNSADLSGGAIFASAGSVTIRHSLLAGNTARRGGGFLGQSSIAFTMDNSTVSGNTASETATSGRGGGLGFFGFATAGGSVLIRNSTITANTAFGFSGGGFHASGNSGNPITVISSIIAGNVHDGTISGSDTVNFRFSPDFYGPYTAKAGAGVPNVTISNSLLGVQNKFAEIKSGAGNQVGSEAAPLNAQLDPLGFYPPAATIKSHQLQAGSPALDTGANPVPFQFDQRGPGFSRTAGQATDVGAFEVQLAPRIAKVTINDGSAQRSRVTSVTIEFDQLVTITGGSAGFLIQRHGDNAKATLNTPGVDNSGPGTKVTLTFAAGPAVDFGSLANGRYTLTAFAANFSNDNGALDGDANGTSGGDFILASATAPAAPSNIWRLFGDSDGDNDVDTTDFASFRLVFGGPGPSIFDFDNDGDVDASDFGQFRTNFGGNV